MDNSSDWIRQVCSQLERTQEAGRSLERHCPHAVATPRHTSQGLFATADGGERTWRGSCGLSTHPSTAPPAAAGRTAAQPVSLPNGLPTSPLVSQGVVTRLALLSPFSFSPAYVLLEPLTGSHGSGQAAAMSPPPEPASALHFLLPAQPPHFCEHRSGQLFTPLPKTPGL